MARIVAGFGTSHGPQLKIAPGRWQDRAVFDQSNTALWFQGASYDYAELAELRETAFAAEVTPQAQRARADRCAQGLDALAEYAAAADVDVWVIVSSDHKEIYGDELLPAFAVYWGESVEHVPFEQQALDAMSPGLALAALGDVPEHAITRPCHPGLARHLLRAVNAEGFDTAASKQLPAGRYGNHGIPHGWGYIYQRILGESCTIPMVPVFVNTFYEPNAPTAARCLAFGQALGRAIATFDEDVRIGVVASGGLSHFVIDEELDTTFLTALIKDDHAFLAGLDSTLLQSGTSELRNWIVADGALDGTGMQAEVVGYEPAYRTDAGTGNAMGFLTWHARKDR